MGKISFRCYFNELCSLGLCYLISNTSKEPETYRANLICFVSYRTLNKLPRIIFLVFNIHTT